MYLVLNKVALRHFYRVVRMMEDSWRKKDIRWQNMKQRKMWLKQAYGEMYKRFDMKKGGK